MTAKRPEDRYADPAEVAAALAPLAHGHQLVKLIEQVTSGNPTASTEDVAKSDTSVAGAIGSETQLVRSSALWKRSSSLLLNTQRAWRRIATAAGAALALALLIWLIIQASHRRESVEAARQSHQAALQLAARLAASEIAQQIGDRFDNLNEVAKNSDLQKMMRQIDAAPKDESLWKPLEDKLGAFKGDYDVQTHAESWFITDAQGIQVARSPRSEASHGENFALRDYFHGQGVDLPTGTPPQKPIDEPHLSAVYRSTTTGSLRVAFSVPITNGRGGSSREVLGVLAMSVDLAEFNVSVKELPAGYEVVLIDLRQAVIDGQSQRGLVLHYQTRNTSGDADVPRWIGRDLLEQIDHALEGEKSDKSSSGNSSLLLADYRDESITRGHIYSGAIERIVDQRPEGESRDIRWLVLVQEPVGE